MIEPGLIETGFGGAASQGILERSASGPYAGVPKRVAASMDRSYGHGRGSDPKVIADVVAEAVRSRRPRTRYAAGKYAKMMIWVRKWLGDHTFDRLIESQM